MSGNSSSKSWEDYFWEVLFEAKKIGIDIRHLNKQKLRRAWRSGLSAKSAVKP